MSPLTRWLYANHRRRTVLSNARHARPATLPAPHAENAPGQAPTNPRPSTARNGEAS